MAKIFTSIFVLIFALLASSSSAYGVSDNGDRVTVKFRSFAKDQQRESLIKDLRILKSEKLRLKDSFILQVPKNRAAEFVANLSKNPLVEYAEKDEVAYALEVPNDPSYPSQWGLEKIAAPGGWNITHGLASVTVAVADTGIDGNHPDLGSKIAVAVDCTNSCVTVSASDGNGHGTHVAGIASAVTNNGIGVAGVGYDSSLASVQVLDSSGSGYYSWIANGIIWASDNGAKVINLSLGGTSSSATLQNAINYAWNKGVVVAAAAGNSGSTRRHYPAYYSPAIAVAATDVNDTRASFSTYGSWVDVAAPGLNILSAYKGDYAYLSGTSMATPFVSGLAGLLFGQHPEWNNSQVRNKIESSADAISGTGTYWRYGRINACRALDCDSVTPSPTPTPTPTPAPSPTSTPIPSLTPSPTPTPEPTPTPVPWWCIRWPFLCS